MKTKISHCNYVHPKPEMYTSYQENTKKGYGYPLVVFGEEYVDFRKANLGMPVI